MRCPRCDAVIRDNSSACSKCGQDVTMINHIVRVSNSYYNKGLEKAQVRDLSGAVIMLRKSLQFNKANTNARNLLGLVLNEMGETVAALSEWVLSKYFQAEDNDADHYINTVQKNPAGLEAISQTIRKYNAALNAARTNSEDLAIIQLKKVISLNPKFVRAYQLLALLYMKSGDYNKAYKYLKRARKIDYNNTTTLRYIFEANAYRDIPTREDRGQQQEVKSKRDPLANVTPVGAYREEKRSWLPYINVIIGIFVGALVTFFLIRPTLMNKAEDDSSNLASVRSELTVKENELTSAKSQVKTLEEKVKKLENSTGEEGDGTSSTALDAYQKLLQGAKLYYVDNKKTEAAAMVATFKKKDFELKEAQEIFDEISKKLSKSEIQAMFETGRASYNSGKYDKAITELQTVLDVDAENQDALYFMGRAYQRKNKKKTAISYYKQVLQVDDSSSRANEAKSRLTQLGVKKDDMMKVSPSPSASPKDTAE